MELINILKIKIRYLLKYDKILYIRKMESIYSIVHITIPSRYEKIIEDGYLCPFRSVQLENL
jgi:hypothetical protein